MSDYVWQPVEGQTRIACDCGECDRTIEVDDGYMQIYGDDEEELTAHLPDEYALCRRVPASAGVPVGAIRKLIAFVDEWGSIGDTEGMPNLWIEVAEARTWLDRITTAEQYAQPQTGQEQE